MSNTLTAMQELIEWSKTEAHFSATDIRIKATELLPKEERQIKNAFSDGRISFSIENGGGEFDDEPIQSFTNAHDYFTQTYKQ